MIIPNMYHTKIQVYSDSGYTTPSYNINIDGTAYIKVKLFDFNGDPVVGESVTLYYDDATSIYTGTTDGNGEISTSHTCSEWGIHTFSTNNQNAQIKVTGWKTFHNDDNFTVTYSENNLVSFQVHNATSYSLTTSWKEFGYTWLTDAFRPVNPVKFFTGDNIICAISDNSGTLKFRSLSGNITSQLWGHVIYRRRG